MECYIRFSDIGRALLHGLLKCDLGATSTALLAPPGQGREIRTLETPYVYATADVRTYKSSPHARSLASQQML